MDFQQRMDTCEQYLMYSVWRPWDILPTIRVLVPAYWTIHTHHVFLSEMIRDELWYSVVPKCLFTWGACLNQSEVPPQKFCFGVPTLRSGSPDSWQASWGSKAALNDFEPIWFGWLVKLQACHAYFSTSSSSCAYFICFLRKICLNTDTFGTLTGIGEVVTC